VGTGSNLVILTKLKRLSQKGSLFLFFEEKSLKYFSNSIGVSYPVVVLLSKVFELTLQQIIARLKF